MIKRFLALLLLAAGSATADVDLSFTDFKSHLQTDLDSTQYQGGMLYVVMQDGGVIVSGCLGAPGYQYISPNLTCPLGTTAFIAQGDVVDNTTGVAIPDGIPDDGLFWSLSTIIPANYVEPFELDRIRLEAAPVGGIATLLRGSKQELSKVFDLTDSSALLFYNYVTFNPLTQFKITLYRMMRFYGDVPYTNQWVDLLGDTNTGDDLPDPADVMLNPPIGDPLHTIDIPEGDPLIRIDTIYAGWAPFNFDFIVPDSVRVATIPRYLDDELERHYHDVPWGTYLFVFPALDTEFGEAPLALTTYTSPDVYPSRGGHVRQGWRMLNDTWHEGALEVDPRLFYKFEWEGVDFSNTVLSDQMFLSMNANQWTDLQGRPHRTLYIPDMAGVMLNPAYPDPLNMPDIPDGEPMFREDVIVFPPFPIQTVPASRSSFEIGVFDGKYELGPFFFTPGDSTIQRLDFRRNLASGASSRDTSRRFLEAEISFIDTYGGFSFFSAPLIPGGFPLGTRTSERNPTGDFDGDGSSNLMEFAFMTDVADPTDMPTFAFDMVDLGGGVGSCTAMVTKRPNIGSSLTYQFEYSSDGMQTWTLIRPGGDWDILEDETMLMVTNIVEITGSGCYLGVKVSQ